MIEHLITWSLKLKSSIGFISMSNRNVRSKNNALLASIAEERTYLPKVYHFY